MPLPVTEIERELVHTRRVRYEGYKRADGLWDIEAHLTDVKNHDFRLKTGVRRAGLPVHDMVVRVTIDRKFNVVDAVAVSDAVPYPGGCEQAAPEYGKLVGLNLLKKFREGLRQRLGGVQGCTHITEMLAALPTAAIQTFAGEFREEGAGGRKPFQLDHCLAMDTSGETVKRWYPEWYAKKEEKAGA
ncbi:MAG: DUF2889 domain-containing protein [Burkholderiales bacterium]